MKQKERTNKKPSAYSEYLDSDFNETESDISYFEANERRHTNAERRKAAPISPEEEQKALLRKEKRLKKQQQNDNFNVLISAAIITVLIFLISILSLTGKDNNFSENENRYLAGRPEASFSSIADGKFMKDMESYLSDQFVARSTLVKARTAADIFCGKKEINSVYLGKKHFLFEKPAEYDSLQVEKTVKSINSFAQKNNKINNYFAIVPNSSEVLKEYMPKNAPCENQQKQIKKIYSLLDKNINTVDIASTLIKSDNKTELYYRTDHHWTTKAAEIAFKQIAANMKLDNSKTELESLAVTNSFQGTLASNSGLFNAKDSIYITVPKTDVKYVVSYIKENKKSASVFDSSKLEQKNKYEVFLGGNFSQINIDTTLNSKKVLMIVKDSYANCLIPMLIPYYKSIVVIDPRYYNDKISDTIKKEGVTDILWLYNANTFLADTSISATFN